MLRVSEIFGPTIQGEGAQIGRPTVFVRLGGCDYRCSWCDTPYAVLSEHRRSWTPTSEEDVLERIDQLAGMPVLVTLSGGNPAIQDCTALIARGQARGHTFTMETQGSVPREWFTLLDHLCVSPKPPSSEMETDWEKLAQCIALGPADTILKVVVFDDHDYAYARKVGALHPEVPIYLQVGNSTPLAEQSDQSALLQRLRWLTDMVVADQWYAARVLPQLHVLMWGNERGV